MAVGSIELRVKGFTKELSFYAKLSFIVFESVLNALPCEEGYFHLLTFHIDLCRILLSKTSVTSCKGRAIPQAVSRRLPTTAARVQTRV
jgi:hypothetical protein